MKTEIFDNYSAFLNRSDNDTNGVSKKFAENNPGFEKENEINKGCWNCSGCSGCSRCSGCSDCSDCSGCSGCSGCSDCSRCSDCQNLKDEKKSKEVSGGLMVVPVIEGIHTKILEAVSRPENNLDMSSWHTCDTTHCRAGWVVTLAGQEGKRLEDLTSTAFAAMQIYKASSPIRVFTPEFYKNDKEAMADIIRCAEEEKSLIK